MSNPYKDYLTFKYKYDGAIERDGSFLLYRFFENELNIGEIFVDPNKRNSNVGTQMANEAMMIAKMKKLKYLSCQTELTGKGDEISMIAILSFGFKPIKADQNKITFIREVQ
jgi:ribosomal protein S18 acetylase RimI-like enzyme